jgi:hypothetical protein
MSDISKADTIKAAKHFTKFWHNPTGKAAVLADNVPTALAIFVKSFPKHISSDYLFDVFSAVAAGSAVPIPSTSTILLWLAENPHAFADADAVLTNPKKVGKLTFQQVCEEAYKAEFLRTVTAVHRFLHAQLIR